MWFPLSLLAAVAYTAMWVAMRSSKKIPVTIVQIAYAVSGPFLLLGFHSTPGLWQSNVWWQFIIWMLVINPAFSWLSTYAVQRTDLTVSKPISSISSIAAMFTGWLAYGETLPALGIAGVLVGVAGLWALYHTRKHAWQKPHPWILLLCVASFGVNATITHEALKIYPDPLVIIGISFSGSLVWWILIAAVKHVRWRPDAGMIKILLIVAIASIIQEIATVVALGMAPSAYVVSIKRLSILLTSVIGYIYFKERELTLTRLITATCIVITGAILLVV